MNLIILYINIFSLGVVFTCSIIIFFLGSKIPSTKFYASFSFFVFLFLTAFVINQAGIKEMNIVIHYLHPFIPILFFLFLLVEIYNKFKLIFLSIFIIPIIFFNIVFSGSSIHLYYHLILWPIVCVIAIYLLKNKNPTDDSLKRKIKFIIIANLIIISPFLFTNFIIIIILKLKFDIILSMFPVTIACTDIISIFFIYRRNLFALNNSYYESIDFIKKSSSFEKKSIIEKISSSIIHEIKNPIAAIKSLIQQLRDEVIKNPSDDISECFDIIDSELVRITDISDSFLKINQNRNENKTTLINLLDQFNIIINLIKFELNKKSISLKYNINSKINIKMSSYDFRQISLNLIYNAIEAEAKNIIITTEEKNDKISILFTDDGKGIEDKIKNKIFKPFFTTKYSNTGMGLSICKEIIHNNSGDIECLEVLNKTAFKITFNKE